MASAYWALRQSSKRLSGNVWFPFLFYSSWPCNETNWRFDLYDNRPQDRFRGQRCLRALLIAISQLNNPPFGGEKFRRLPLGGSIIFAREQAWILVDVDLFGVISDYFVCRVYH